LTATRFRPTLISDYSGTPTRFGIGLREPLRALHAARRSSAQR
jgi:hypothetical protein